MTAMAEAAATCKQEGRNAEAVNRVTGIIESELIVILSILWGGSFFFVGVAVQDVSPRTIVWCRAARPWRLCSDWRL
jgi:hypothetical protein